MTCESFLGFSEEEEIYKSFTKTDQFLTFLLRVSRNLSSHTKASIFPGKLLLNMIPQTTVVSDTTVSKWPKSIKYTEID